jgi:hypothetical protein
MKGEQQIDRGHGKGGCGQATIQMQGCLSSTSHGHGQTQDLAKD